MTLYLAITRRKARKSALESRDLQVLIKGKVENCPVVRLIQFLNSFRETANSSSILERKETARLAASFSLQKPLSLMMLGLLVSVEWTACTSGEETSGMKSAYGF